jgi:hypothetical protein
LRLAALDRYRRIPKCCDHTSAWQADRQLAAALDELEAFQKVHAEQDLIAWEVGQYRRAQIDSG